MPFIVLSNNGWCLSPLQVPVTASRLQKPKGLLYYQDNYHELGGGGLH